jgi:integrase
MGPNLALRLNRYVEQRHGSNAAPERPLFSFTKRGCIHEGTISQTFHSLLPKLQLHIPPGVSPPRLHDLRHSFAVATLLRWYRQGIDPNCRLMHLATFLGHVDPNSTAVYLTITEELLHQAAQRFQILAPKGGVR